MGLPMHVSYAGLSLFIFKAGVILLRFMRLYAYNLTIVEYIGVTEPLNFLDFNFGITGKNEAASTFSK